MILMSHDDASICLMKELLDAHIPSPVPLVRPRRQERPLPGFPLHFHSFAQSGREVRGFSHAHLLHPPILTLLSMNVAVLSHILALALVLITCRICALLVKMLYAELLIYDQIIHVGLDKQWMYIAL